MQLTSILFVVVLSEVLLPDTSQLASRQKPEQLPADGKSFLDAAVVVEALRYVALFKLVCKLRIEQVCRRESRLAEYDHELLCVLSAGICREELVHRVGVVGAGLALADTLVFQS